MYILYKFQINMRHMIHALQDLGMTFNEVKIYLTCLEYGGLTALGIARLTNIPRTTVYITIEKLLEKKFLTYKKKTTTSMYYAISGEEIIALLDQDIKKISEKKKHIKDNLYAINNISKASTQLPHIQFYEENESYSKIEKLLISTKNFYILYHIQKTFFINSDDFFRSFIKKCVAQNIETKILLVSSDRAKDFRRDFSKDNIHIKLLPSSFFTFSQQFISDNGYYHLTYGDKPYLMEIIDPLLVNIQKTQFEILRKLTS